MKTRSYALAGCAILGILVASGVARADTTEDTEKYIRVVQQKPFLKLLRAELVPTFAVALAGPPTTTHIGTGGTLRFHITEEWSVGVDYLKYFGWESSLVGQIREQFTVLPPERLMDFYAGAHTTYTPVFGKFLLFNGPIVYWELYLMAGMGVTRTWGVGGDALCPTGNLGLGMRWMLTRWLTLNLEVRDYLFSNPYADGSKFVNNVTFQAGLGVFVPFKHDYVYPK